MLSVLAGLPFRDMDEEIEAREGMTIAQIFEKKGEACFREAEHQLLLTLTKSPPSVIATGGGVPCFRENLEIMRSAGIVVYLQCTPDELYEWLSVFKGDRPLLKNLEGPALLHWITEELGKREQWYLKADLVIQAYHTLPSELFGKISSAI